MQISGFRVRKDQNEWVSLVSMSMSESWQPWLWFASNKLNNRSIYYYKLLPKSKSMQLLQINAIPKSEKKIMLIVVIWECESTSAGEDMHAAHAMHATTHSLPCDCMQLHVVCTVYIQHVHINCGLASSMLDQLISIGCVCVCNSMYT